MRSKLLRLEFQLSYRWKFKPTIPAMATEANLDVTKLKGSKISVVVEDALVDVLVVSYHVGAKIFQGALLDISKTNAPYGIVPPSPPKPEVEGNMPGVENAADEKTDKLYSVKQRHTYYQIPAGTTHFFIGRYARSAKDKSVRMRRLRPRKILCSHCQETFNDDATQKKGMATRTSSAKNHQSTNSPATAGQIPCDNRNRVLTRSTRTDFNGSKKTNDDRRLTCQTESKPLKDDCSESSNSSEKSYLQNTPLSDKKSDLQNFPLSNKKPELQSAPLSDRKPEKMVLRKRKMSFPESIPQAALPVEKQSKRADLARNNSEDSNSSGATLISALTAAPPCLSKSGLAKTSPVIKISFANPQGKDTVLKIPARVQLTSDTEEESNWTTSPTQESSDYAAEKTASAKAAKKALKKAKKEAQRKATNVVFTPTQENGNASEKDRHHHHKHKVKKKRKHKSDDETDKFNSENTDIRNVFNSNGSGNNNSSSGNSDGWCLKTSFSGELPLVSSEINKPPPPPPPSSVFDDVKTKCLHQKLSISLKRLNAKGYMRCSPKYSIEDDSIVSDISDASSGSVGSGDGSDYGDVPDFPKHSSPLRDIDKVKPLMMRISTHNVKKCVLDLGREMTVGDIVWGKIHGFPWWPGKVLALTVSQRDNGAFINQQAHVSWFGSSTSSYMPCNQLTPFMEEFKIRYNKKKRGPYKEAIRQAWQEANVVPPKDIHELNFVAAT